MPLKDLLFAAALKPTVQKVDVSEWFPNHEVFVRVINGSDADKYNSAVAKASEDKNFLVMEATLVALSLCDAEGMGICTLDDLPQIMNWPSKRIDKIFGVASKLNRLSDQDTIEGN